MRRSSARLGQALALALGAAVANELRVWRRGSVESGPIGGPSPSPSFSDWPTQPFVSVLVAAWNEAANVDDLVRSFLALNYPNRELILCAGGTDDTYGRAKRWTDPRLKVREQSAGEGKQQALRRLLAEAKGSVIFLTDADCVFTNESFLRTVEPIVTADAAVTTGASEPKPVQRQIPLVQYQWFIDLAWYTQRPLVVTGVLGRNCAIRRDVLAAIGGFDMPVRTGTDYVLGQLLSLARYEIRSVADSRIETEYPATAGAYLRMWRRWNKNLLIHGPRYGAWGDVRGVVTACGLSGVIFGPLLLTPVLGPLAMIIPTLLFAVAVKGRLRRVAAGATLANRPRSWRLFAGIPLYTVLDLVAVLLAVADFVRPSRRDRW